MIPISAVDSVSLAIQRTREFLFRQFTWGTYLKLSLVAIITEGVWGQLVPLLVALFRVEWNIDPRSIRRSTARLAGRLRMASGSHRECLRRLPQPWWS